MQGELFQYGDWTELKLGTQNCLFSDSHTLEQNTYHCYVLESSPKYADGVIAKVMFRERDDGKVDLAQYRYRHKKSSADIENIYQTDFTLKEIRLMIEFPSNGIAMLGQDRLEASKNVFKRVFENYAELIGFAAEPEREALDTPRLKLVGARPN